MDENLNTLGVIKNNNLLFSTPTSFNDPFDSYAILNYDFSKITRQDAMIFLKIDISPAKFISNKLNYIKQLENHPEILEWTSKSRDTFHITCFNNSPLNILMWSHYADHHKGFMLEFKFKKSTTLTTNGITQVYRSMPMPVFYNDEFPKIKYPFNLDSNYCIQNPEFGSELIIKRTLSKAKVWSYENEFRMIYTGDNPHKSQKVFGTYEPDSLSSVIFGALMSTTHKDAIIEAIRDFNNKHQANVQTYDSKLHPEQYVLNVINHPRLNTVTK